MNTPATSTQAIAQVRTAATVSTASLASATQRAGLLALVQQPALAASAALAGRLLLAAIFLVSAAGKLADPQGTISYIASVGLPAPALGYAAALAAELVGGVLLVLGWQTRWAALVLAGFSVASAVAFHNALGDQNQLFHFLKNLALAGGLLQVAAFGAGAFSVDGRGNKRR